VNDIVIHAENVSKAYQLGDFGTGTLSRDIERWWALVRGKEDPFLKIGESNDRTVQGGSDIVWSLNDINFEIERGDAVGIIGRNGAGKSTLLKLLSRVTVPTTGEIKVKGRIASLLEVGTGFHPELTGRENIFLNGAILGMRKAEIKKQFDNIVAFGGVERYIDTPVKRYSSGMYVRLAFAVAAHLESEILIVDEVLAVGDAEFQQKCLGKMSQVSKSEGRTVLFVSHNMGAINNLCNKSILLHNGLMQDYDKTSLIIDKYMQMGGNNQGEVLVNQIHISKNGSRASFTALRMTSVSRGVTNSFLIDEEISVEIDFEVLVENAKVFPSIHLLDNLGTCIFSTFNAPSASLTFDPFYGIPLKRGRYRSVCKIPGNFLNTKKYNISAFLVPESMDEMTAAENVLSFSVEENGEMRKEYNGDWWGGVRPRFAWSTTAIAV
jgi:lipopolysaccharide transport system ATP-binding protein